MIDIKPPTGPGAADATAAAEAGQERSEGVQGPGLSAFVDAAQASQGNSAVQEPLAALAAQVRSGALTQEQAVEQLIEGALSGMESTLSESQRQDLVETMRHALQNDPTLLALQAELSQ